MQNAQVSTEHNAYPSAMQVAYARKVPKEKYQGPRLARRQHWLKVLVSEHGGPAKVGAEIATPPSHVSAMIAGTRGVGDALADRIEEAFDKPNGWLDQPIEVRSGEKERPPVTLKEALAFQQKLLDGLSPLDRQIAQAALRHFLDQPKDVEDVLKRLESILNQRRLGGMSSGLDDSTPQAA